MTTIAYSPVNIQTSARSVPSIPNWFGEITLLAHHLQQQGVLAAIEEQVRFSRRRFGRYEVIDFVAVLFGYAVSGERTLEAFYEHLQPWADAFMALFGRDRSPARPATNGGSACSPAAFASTVCPWLHGTQARGSREEPDHSFAGAYASVSRHVWKPRQWGVPGRTATGRHGHTQ